MTDIVHYSCEHGAEQIRKAGFVVVPQQQIVLGNPTLSWWTHVPNPPRAALGLTSHSLSCDRMDHRFRALDGSALFRWNDVRHVFPRQGVLRLEAARGARPAYWWVSTEPVEVEEL